MDKLEKIAYDIVGYSSGAYKIYYPEEFFELSETNKSIVLEMAMESLSECSGCGWIYELDHLECVDEGYYCPSCITEMTDEEE